MIFWILFLDSVSHSWGVPTMKITDLSILCKWENLKNRQCVKYLFAPLLGLHDILHAIVMCVSSVKTVLWLAVNLHQLFSHGVAFNTQNHSSLTSYAISRSLSHSIHLRLWARICVAPFENSWWRFTANHRTVFTDEMRMTIACKILCSPNIYIYMHTYIHTELGSNWLHVIWIM